MCASEGIEELSAEELTEGADGKEVVDGGGDPAQRIEGQAAAGDDAMDMGVKAQVACPGVQDAGDAEVGAEALGISAEFEEGGSGGGEEEVEDELSVGEGEASELPREGEDDVEGVCGEHACHALLDPSELGERLALWAMSISAGVVGLPVDMAALGADVPVPAELGRPATSDVAQDGLLLRSQSVSAREGLAVGADDVRELQRRPWGRTPARRGARVTAHRALAERLFGLRRAEDVDGTLDLGDVLGGDAGVAEGGGNRGVAEEHLNDADVGAELEEVSGETVPQDVGSDRLLDAGLEGGLVEVVSNGIDADGVSRLLAVADQGVARGSDESRRSCGSAWGADASR